MKPSKPFVMPPVRIIPPTLEGQKPPKSIDLSDSHIRGIRLNLLDIRGTIANTSQTMDLTALLSITIKD